MKLLRTMLKDYKNGWQGYRLYKEKAQEEEKMQRTKEKAAYDARSFKDKAVGVIASLVGFAFLAFILFGIVGSIDDIKKYGGLREWWHSNDTEVVVNEVQYVVIQTHMFWATAKEEFEAVNLKAGYLCSNHAGTKPYAKLTGKKSPNLYYYDCVR